MGGQLLDPLAENVLVHVEIVGCLRHRDHALLYQLYRLDLNSRPNFRRSSATSSFTKTRVLGFHETGSRPPR